MFAAALALPLLALVAPALAAPVELVTRADNARYTWYYTHVGLGACGIWHADSEYTVALNSADWNAAGGGYPSPSCGKQITISYGGKTAVATIQDECPTCPQGGLDLSPGLFQHFADQGAGVIYGSWWYGGNSGNSNSNSNNNQQQSSPTVSTSQSSGGQRIHPGKNSGKCLTSQGSWNGAEVSLQDCNGSSNQNWNIQKGTNKVKLDGTNYCLDAGVNPHSGVTSKVWTCLDVPQQWWNWTDDNRFVSANNQCMDNRSGWSSQSQTWQCAGQNKNQEFYAW